MITMQNVRKKYKDFELELSLEIPEGRITGFVGKNGAGKSTAIKLRWRASGCGKAENRSIFDGGRL